MKELEIVTSNMKYSILIHNDFSMIKNRVKLLFKGKRIAVITDDNVGNLHLSDLFDSLSDDSYVLYSLLIKHGEDNKSSTTLFQIYDFLMDISFERSDLIIALGGGVVGDVVGYAAATYLRGVSFIQIPTTLLAQIDSSIGGKVAINYRNIKNNIGAFHQPILVYINTEVLKTLPEREFRNGLAEIVVHGIIQDASLISFTINYFKNFPNIDFDLIVELIYRNCEIKANIVMQDEKDHGIRKILNFGHTIGHAIESSYNYKYTHGECVSIGIVTSFKLSFLCQLIGKEKLKYIKDVLKTLNLPIKIDNMDWINVIDKIVYDKKVKLGEPVFILPTEAGNVIEYKISTDSLMNFTGQLNDL